jgi:hypothetical protein
MRALGIIAAVVCFLAGIQMWMIWGGGSSPLTGGSSSIFEAGYHAIGTYFIAKGLFIIFVTEVSEKRPKPA